jgi:hypothetical protein
MSEFFHYQVNCTVVFSATILLHSKGIHFFATFINSWPMSLKEKVQSIGNNTIVCKLNLTIMNSDRHLKNTRKIQI